MKELLESLHKDLKELNVNYKAHAMIDNLMRQYKQKSEAIKKDSDATD